MNASSTRSSVPSPAPPLRAVLVDDEPLARDELMFLLDQCEGVEVAGEAEDASGALSAIEAARPDVVFADLRMAGPDGIALADAIRSRWPELPVVIVSAHDDGAVRAFEAAVLDYLLKPVRLERLRAAIERVRAHHGGARGRSGRASEPPHGLGEEGASEHLSRLAVRRRGTYVVVDLDDVIFFETRDELVWAVTADDRFSLDLTLTKLEEELGGERFFRSHRGALVRIDRIAAIKPKGSGVYELVMDHPEDLRVTLSRDKAKLLRERIPFTG